LLTGSHPAAEGLQRLLTHPKVFNLKVFVNWIPPSCRRITEVANPSKGFKPSKYLLTGSHPAAKGLQRALTHPKVFNLKIFVNWI
jgi:hypothetical protein